MNSQNELIHSVLETLRQGELLLRSIGDETYALRHPQVFNASIGGHYRHCLDHFRSLLASAESGELNYDLRQRDTIVENNRHAALNATHLLLKGYEQLKPSCLARPLSVTCKTSYSTLGSQISDSTVGREMMYSVAHAVHHYALIGIMGGLLNVELPAGFGVAPSTLKHQAETMKPALAA